ncbi:MAG: NAD(P)H-hydrate dehydratase [Candidatus Omnitrophica bacterium]|nr:NAD(P)H-hydrate dehydratase [Candidatus Omnitrophota bacterium]
MPARLLQRKSKAHKGEFGNILILAGSAAYSGAGVLSAAAAMRSGAGLVTLGIPEGLNNAVIKIKPKEVMTLSLPQTKDGSLSSGGYKRIRDFIKNIDVLAIGPGLGPQKSTQSLIRKLISAVDKPMVIDADGLNALVGHLDLLKSTMILTPHAGEMSRLTDISTKIIQGKRKEIAKKFSHDHKVTLVLKGHNTIVADHRGGYYLNKTGNPGMATGGSGDVLTGMIAAFLGQGLGVFEAAKYAVYLHGVAGDLAARKKTEISLIASDIIDEIPQAIKKSS